MPEHSADCPRMASSALSECPSCAWLISRVSIDTGSFPFLAVCSGGSHTTSPPLGRAFSLSVPPSSILVRACRPSLPSPPPQLSFINITTDIHLDDGFAARHATGNLVAQTSAIKSTVSGLRLRRPPRLCTGPPRFTSKGPNKACIAASSPSAPVPNPPARPESLRIDSDLPTIPRL